MPPVTTRTLNPLPFEHLEPKRFEDLVRQLAYEFRPWRQLEATGRGGSDDGFDARGFEILPTGEVSEIDSEQDIVDETTTDRLWLIQCKREQSITPSKMRAHLEAIPPESREDLYGFVFAASCNPSKITRDVFRQWCAENGIAECHIWGRAELEDMLYQPKNDNLLFAYFGISLQIRRQKTAANLRRITTVKRKLKRLIEKSGVRRLHVLVRDPADDRFPFTEGTNFKDGKFLWRVLKVHGLGVFGLRFIAREHFAFLDRDTGNWDVATGGNNAIPLEHFNPWYKRQVTESDHELETETRHFWLSLNDANMQTAYFIAEIPYEEIIEIDEVGNDEFGLATVFVQFRNGRVPEGRHSIVAISKSEDLGWAFYPDREGQHVRVFPDEFRDNEIDTHWSNAHNIDFSKDRLEVPLNPPDWVVELRAMRAEQHRAANDLPKEPQ
nr:hypothetical protein [Methylobacterium sp. L1A1]